MLVFENPGLIDETALTTMAVSVKTGESPIGQFGTGLKYAIAIVLRLGGRITILRGRRALVFGVRERTIRGREFRVITLDGRPLGWTDQMGAHWEPWMAYRELWSNARDEGGRVWRAESADDVTAEPRVTKVLVECPELERAHEERYRIILQTEPLVVCPGVEIHAGASRYIYYRGIRVGELQGDEAALYTYNLTGHQSLTEDRTLQYPWMVASTVARALVQCTNAAVLHDVIGDDTDRLKTWEDRLPWRQVADQRPSPQFMEVADQLNLARRLRTGAGQLFRDYQDTLPGYTSPYLVTLTGAEEEVLSRALSLLGARSLPQPERGALTFKSRLELGRVQASRSDGLVLDHKLIAAGPEDLAAALLEGMAMLAGGSVAQQLCRLMVSGAFAQEPTARPVGEEDLVI